MHYLCRSHCLFFLYVQVFLADHRVTSQKPGVVLCLKIASGNLVSIQIRSFEPLTEHTLKLNFQ